MCRGYVRFHDQRNNLSVVLFLHYVVLMMFDTIPSLQVLLIENDINSRPFAEAVLACLPPLPWSFSEQDLLQNQRKDLRHLRVFSVDPIGKHSDFLLPYLNCSELFPATNEWFHLLCRLQGYWWCIALYTSVWWPIWSWCAYPSFQILDFQNHRIEFKSYVLVFFGE